MSLTYIIEILSAQTIPALFILTLLEGANIPLPSEPTLLFTGLVSVQNGYNIWLLALVAAVGSTIGADTSYVIGRWGGRPLIYKYRKLLLLTKKELDQSDRWFDEHRIPIILISRMFPLVRTLISFPAGIYETPFWLFNLLTFVGCYVWSLLFIYLGTLLGDRWEMILPYVEQFALLVTLLVGGLIVWYIWHKLHKIRHEKDED